MGTVYVAEHKLMGRTVALKTIQLRLADDPALVERFLREVRASAKLNHENVVGVYDAEQTQEALFLVMEYLEGQDLRQLVVHNGRLDLPTACSLLRQAVLGVQHAHERGVVHRDIKPNNLFLVSGADQIAYRRVKVLDFGLAKVLQDAGVYHYGTPAGFAMGTVGYMSPEQAADTRSVGIHADIFSLGRTLYYLLSGRLPYRDGIRSLMLEESGQQAVVPLDELRPDLPPEAVALVERMTARRQEDRFQSCEEVLAALEPMCRAEPGAAPDPAGM
jgi:serine/threonine protein kinase